MISSLLMKAVEKGYHVTISKRISQRVYVVEMVFLPKIRGGKSFACRRVIPEIRLNEADYVDHVLGGMIHHLDKNTSEELEREPFSSDACEHTGDEGYF